MMNRILPVFLWLILLISADIARGQGCVAVRPMSCSAGGAGNNLGLLNKGEWQLTTTYQYFKSFRHFRGDVEEHERIENNTQVENISHSLNLGIANQLTRRFALSLTVPVLYYDRSSLYEHYGNRITSNPDQKRFHTGSMGLGDIRVTGNYWLWNPDRDSLRGNVLLGMGLKMPTGNSNVTGDFHKLSSEGTDSITRRPVDQSIQLGDGGWGFTLEMQGFWKISERGWLYANGFYLFNPQEVNQTLTRGTLAGVDPLIAYHSIADQFAFRTGINYIVAPMQGISASLGFRAEGVPSKDIFGGSSGFRRPGYVLSAEPGIFYIRHKLIASVNVPFALYRNRTKSTYDLSDPTGERHGDAAFADYLINLTVIYRFGKVK